MNLETIVRPSALASPNPPVLVLLHGLGADEHDLMALAPELQPEWTIVSVRAPRLLPWGGYSWFDLEFSEAGRWVDESQAVESRDLVAALLEQIRADAKPAKLVLAGFSQGAAISLGVALARPDLLDGVVLLSGAFLPAFGAQSDKTGVLQVPFLVQHGTFDQVLPVEEGRETRDALVRLGVQPDYREYAMAHEIGLESLEHIRSWLGCLLQAGVEAC